MDPDTWRLLRERIPIWRRERDALRAERRRLHLRLVAIDEEIDLRVARLQLALSLVGDPDA